MTMQYAVFTYPFHVACVANVEIVRFAFLPGMCEAIHLRFEWDAFLNANSLTTEEPDSILQQFILTINNKILLNVPFQHHIAFRTDFLNEWQQRLKTRHWSYFENAFIDFVAW